MRDNYNNNIIKLLWRVKKHLHYIIDFSPFITRFIIGIILLQSITSQTVFAHEKPVLNQTIKFNGQTGVDHSKVLMDILQLDAKDRSLNASILNYNFPFLSDIDPDQETIGNTPYEIFSAYLFFTDVWLSIYMNDDSFKNNSTLMLLLYEQEALYLERLASIQLSGRTYYSDLFYLGNNVSKQNLKQSIAWTKTAAQLGLTSAQMALANYYGQLENHEDFLEAYKWLLLLANNNDSEAIYRLGTYFEDGLGVQRNFKRAFYYYQKAAISGDVRAYSKLGKFYAKGLAINKDLQAAFNYYLQAAQKGDADSQAYIAKAYLLGNEVEQNDEQAFLWSYRAATHFDKHYQCLYGEMLFNGRGTVENKLAGYTFCKVATLISEKTDKNIENKLNHMAAVMNISDVKAANEIAHSCYKAGFYSCANALNITVPIPY